MPPLKAFARTDLRTPNKSQNDGSRSSAPHGRSSLSTNVVTVDDTGSPMVSSSSSRHLPNRLEQPSSHESTPVKAMPRSFGMSTSKSIPNMRHLAERPTSMSTSTSTEIHTPINQIRTRSRQSLAGTPLHDHGHLTPYYSPSTPSQFSRSTILPFDRESNRHDAEEAIRESAKKPSPKQVQDVGTPPVEGGWKRGLLNFGRKSSEDAFSSRASVKRKGIVRKAKLSDRIIAYPRYAYEEAVDFITDLTLPPHTAPYISLLLHTLHFLIRAPLWQIFLSFLPLGRSSRWTQKPTDSVFVQPDSGLKRYDQMVEAGKQGWKILGWLGLGSTSVWGAFGNWLFFLIVFGISFANASYLFNSRRRYDMRFRKDQLNTPNARSVPVPNSRDLEMEDEDVAQWTAKKVFFLVWSYINPLTLIRIMIGKPPHIKREEEKRAQEMMQSLTVWDPPEFNMIFFIYYSPIQPVLFQLIGYTNPIIALICNACITAQTIFVVKEFERLVKDRQILQREVMREYDQVFVYKQLFKTKKDASTQTNEGM
ncbi:hypothetical protein FFLO_01800 [Filobasidium floriforme]|uniref:Uncharacterized protein n=1 Tax=Filobasidium floriforme TaxID=5210 RepID=A0A8K0JNU1_9TREE|nr:hypothetical protein FFLO_01800 [Filobasidium floriforme]